MKRILAFLVLASCAYAGMWMASPGKGSHAAAAGGTVTFDASATGTFTGTAASSELTLTYSMTVGSGSNRCLIVHIGQGGTVVTISGVTYGGVAMTQVGTSQLVGGSANGSTSFWRLLNPASGTANVVVTWSPDITTNQVIASEASSWTNVNQTTPITNITQTNGSSVSPSVTVTSATNSRVIAGSNDGSSYSAWAATDRGHNNVNTLTGGGNSAMSDRAGSASETMTWTAGNDTWAAIGFSLNP